MKFREILRFELTYQLRRPSAWLSFVVLIVVSILFIRQNFLSDALYDDFHVNSPLIIASVTVFTSLLWFLIAAPIAGDLGARDAEAGMHPLTYTAPVSKAEYLGGRFLAAFLLNAVLLLAVPLGILLSVYGPGVDPQVIGPFRPASYLTAYGFIALPNAFVGTAIQFTWAALGRRAIASYLGSVVLFFAAYGGFVFVSFFVGREDLAALLDVFGHIYITSDVILGWTPIERNTRVIQLEGTLVRSRILWVGIASVALGVAYGRFRFAHHTNQPLWSRITRRRDAHAPTPSGTDISTSPIRVPTVVQTSDFGTRLRQALVIAKVSFGSIAKSRTGLPLLIAIAALIVVVMPQNLQNLGTPLVPRTGHLLTFLTARLTDPITPWVIVPLLTIFYSGELVWREREAGLGEISDATPVPEWVLLAGRFLGLSLILALWTALLVTAGVLIQLRMGYSGFELGLYLKVLFGLQLTEYLLFAMLALVVQGMVNQKYLGHLAALMAYISIVFAPALGVEHPQLIYGAGPGWSYSDMRGFGSSLGPWLWFKLYWAAGALLLAVIGRVLWMRGLEASLRVRMELARQRLTRPTMVAAALAVGLILPLGGFIFYNTNVLNDLDTEAAAVERSAEYERRFGQFASTPQPALSDVKLQVEIFPGRRAARVRGTYTLVNRGSGPIDTLHLATVSGVETEVVEFDRAARAVVVDVDLGHSIYELESPLQPGDSARLTFQVEREPRGFAGGTSIHANGTWFTNEEWLPAIGYQASRELIRPGQRREHGLPERPLLPTLADVAAAQDITGEAAGDFGAGDGIRVESVIGTDPDQVAIGPGVLRRSWEQDGRRYFHYVTEAPIGNQYSYFSAAYTVLEESWRDVAIRIYHHPGHAANVDRLLHSVRASLEHNSREFGPYAHSQLTLIENPARGFGAHAEASVIDYGQGFSLYDTDADPQDLDFPFAVMAHEMGHQFCCPIARVEGAGLLTESFAWYAAMGVVEETFGRDHLRRLLRFMRQPTPIPPIRQSVPLLQGMDPYAAYRKGPFALFALREYLGAQGVNGAFRRIREKHGAGLLPQPTSLDLYREFQAVTPDSLKPLLHDLFAANTFWQLATRRATATEMPDGSWDVALEVTARKVTVDPSGVETELAMDEWVEVGVFARTRESVEFGETLYLAKHRIRSGEQTIRVKVAEQPADAGVDPYILLIDLERFDNVVEVDGAR